MSNFQGFEAPSQNWSKLPHQLIDALSEIKTIGEMKVILYTLRHTWGYQDDYKKITLSEFEKGRKRKDGTRIDDGTGLSRPTIVDGIKRAVLAGFLFEHIDTSDSARVKKFYSLTKQGLRNLTPDVKKFNPRGKETLHRTEKETIEKETIDRGPQNSNHKGIAQITNPSPEDTLNTLADQISDICAIDINTAAKRTREAIKTLTLALCEKEDISNLLVSFPDWWYANDWRGIKGQPPTPAQMGDAWAQFEGLTKEKKSVVSTDGGFYI